MTERQSTAQPFYSKNSNCGKQLYSALIELLHLIIRVLDQLYRTYRTDSTYSLLTADQSEILNLKSEIPERHLPSSLNELTAQANL